MFPTLALIAFGLSSFAHANEDATELLNRRLRRQNDADTTLSQSQANPDLYPASTQYPEMKVNFTKLVRYGPQAQAKADRVKHILEAVLNSEELEARVLNFEWDGKRQFASTAISNGEVYHSIRVGHELAYEGEEHSLDIENEIYWPFALWFWKKWSVVGYTLPDSPRIWTNGNWFYRMTDAELAGHFVHEWLHKIGFGHDFNRTAKRPYSVPYGVGGIIEDIAVRQFP